MLTCGGALRPGSANCSLRRLAAGWGRIWCHSCRLLHCCHPGSLWLSSKTGRHAAQFAERALWLLWGSLLAAGWAACGCLRARRGCDLPVTPCSCRC
jgi:hypothetical protein